MTSADSFTSLSRGEQNMMSKVSSFTSSTIHCFITVDLILDNFLLCLSTQEARAFQLHSSELFSRLKRFSNLLTRLHRSGIISRTMLNSISASSSHAEWKSVLLKSVESQIAQNPGIFYRFLNILSEYDQSILAICQKMKQEIGESLRTNILDQLCYTDHTWKSTKKPYKHELYLQHL